jgi:hypothetical protein
MAIKYTNILLTLQDPTKLIQIGIFGMKICHLAALNWSKYRDKNGDEATWK